MTTNANSRHERRVARDSAQPTARPATAATCPCCGQALAGLTGLTIERDTGVVSTRRGSVGLGPSEQALVESLLEAFPAALSEAYLASILNIAPVTGRPLIAKARHKLEPIGVAIVNVNRRGYRLQVRQ